MLGTALKKNLETWPRKTLSTSRTTVCYTGQSTCKGWKRAHLGKKTGWGDVSKWVHFRISPHPLQTFIWYFHCVPLRRSRQLNNPKQYILNESHSSVIQISETTLPNYSSSSTYNCLTFHYFMQVSQVILNCLIALKLPILYLFNAKSLFTKITYLIFCNYSSLFGSIFHFQLPI